MAGSPRVSMETESAQEADFVADMNELTTKVSIAQQPDKTPPHRSHDPTSNQKRSDPFQFGSRYLQDTDNVFEFNAWDHVETDETYKEYAEVQYAKQRESPVSEFDKSMLQSLYTEMCVYLAS